MLEEPFCSNCGYVLTGLTESPRCPECGKPLVEVLQRRNAPAAGRRYTSPIRIFGWPLVQVAYGPHGSERVGRARAIIALGDQAVGVLAIGGLSAGLFAWGGLAFGGFAFGGVAVGLVTFGGVALALLAAGGVSIGLLAGGGVALGYVVYSAGLGVAYYGRGGLIHAVHALGGNARSPTAQQFFADNAWLFGHDPFGFMLWLWVFAAMLVVAALVFLLLLIAYLLGQRHRTPDA